MYAINCFFFFAILGFLFESLFFILIKKPYNSSTLLGPWTTVYGIAFFIILFIGNWLKKFHFSKSIEVVLFFLLNTFILSMLEFIAGELILFISKVRYWNYQNLTWNIDGFICLEVSLFWGLGSIILYYFLYPKIKPFLKKIPKFITILLVLLYSLDILFMVFKAFYNKII